jgi:hypothetical protein
VTPATTKTAIVTGAPQGIGRAVDLRLLRDGFTAWEQAMNTITTKDGTQFASKDWAPGSR